MRHRYPILILVLIIMLMVMSPFPPSTKAVKAYSRVGNLSESFEESQASQQIGDETLALNISKDDHSGLTFTFEVNWEEMRLATIENQGEFYTKISMPGWVNTNNPGAPQLPFMTKQLGVPIGYVVSIDVKPGFSHYQTIEYPILPATTSLVSLPEYDRSSGFLELPDRIDEIRKDLSIYGSDKIFPKELAKITDDAMLRQQRIVGINLFPVQYQPLKNELIVYESLTVTVKFTGTNNVLQNTIASESFVFENLLNENLLNYDNAKKWRQTEADRVLLTGNSQEDFSTLPYEPPVPGWRIKIVENGIFRLGYTELEEAGFPVSTVDPHSIQMFHLGEEIAIRIIGEEDSSFDQLDYILFYGQSYNTKYTNKNVYWLTFDIMDEGLRMSENNGSPTDGLSPESFITSLHLEDNLIYQSQIPGDADLDRWVGARLFPPSIPNWTRWFDLTSPSGDAASLKISVFGFLQSPVYPDHHMKVYINNSLVGDYTFDGITYQVFEMAIPEGLLVAGQNNLTINAPNDTGLAYDQFFIDWADLTYNSNFIASSTGLQFDHAEPGTWLFEVGGFTTPDVDVFDVTNSHKVKIYSGVKITEASGIFTASYQDLIITPKSYLLFEEGNINSVFSIEADDPSDLHSLDNGADFIIITPETFVMQAETLKEFRASQGLRAMVVELQDIYDEFGYGIDGVKTIQEFLSFTYYNWQSPAPTYIVLLGDGNYDPKNYSGISLENHIPSFLAPVDPWIKETAADNRYVTIVGEDILPDMILGRLPVNNADEAEIVINKIINYEINSTPGMWQKNVLFVADDADEAGNFANLNDNLIDCCLPDVYSAEKVYFKVTHHTVSEAKTAVLTGINNGALITNYIGHAAYSQWTDEGIFKTQDVNSLINASKLTIVLPMTCFDGYYLYPFLGFDSTAELITRALGKGAVASWSPTGLGVASGHDYLNRGFYDAVFINGATTIGEGTAAGKLHLWSTGNNRDLVDTYLLFGDPATRFPNVDMPETSNIPDQTIYQSQQFMAIHLDDYVIDPDHADDQLAWSYSGNNSLSVEIVNRVATITILNPDWTGTETLTFRATDPDTYYDETSVNFTVLEWPFRIWLPNVQK